MVQTIIGPVTTAQTLAVRTDPPAARQPARPPLWDRRFTLYFTARTVSLFGDAMMPVAAALAVGALYGISGVGFVLGTWTGTFVVLVLFGGVFADRLGARRMMVGADLARVLTQGILAAAFFAGPPPFWLLITMAALAGAAVAMFQPGVNGMVPLVAREPQRANATLKVADALAQLLGPALAGLLIAVTNAGTVYAIDSSTFLLSALCLALIRLAPAAVPADTDTAAATDARTNAPAAAPPDAPAAADPRPGIPPSTDTRADAPATAPSDTPAAADARTDFPPGAPTNSDMAALADARTNAPAGAGTRTGIPSGADSPAPAPAPTGSSLRRDLRQGWQEFRARTWMWAVILIWVAYGVLVFGPLVPLSSSLIGARLGSNAYGLAVSFLGIGTVLGGVLALRLRPARPLAAGAAAMALFTVQPLCVALGADLPVLLVGHILGGGAMAFWSVMWATSVQTHTPPEVLNRVSAFELAGSVSGIALGQILAGPATALASPARLLLVSVGTCLAGSAALFLIPAIRTLRREIDISGD